MKKIKGTLLIIVLIVLDQLTKVWACDTLIGNPISIIKGVFGLTYVENRGAAFGMLQNKIVFFLVVTIVVLGAIYFVMKKLPEDKKYTPIRICAILIVSGAIGNMIDRVIRNYVVDFLYFELIDFPVFNVADCYVTIAAFVLILLFIFYYKDEDFAFLSKKTRKDAE